MFSLWDTKAFKWHFFSYLSCTCFFKWWHYLIYKIVNVDGGIDREFAHCLTFAGVFREVLKKANILYFQGSVIDLFLPVCTVSVYNIMVGCFMTS